MEVLETGSDHVFTYQRARGGKRLVIAANFSEREQVVGARYLPTDGAAETATDLITGQQFAASQDIYLAPYQFMWLLL